MTRQHARADRAINGKIEAIVDEFLERWDGLPVSARSGEAVIKELESNGQILDSLLERLTKNLGPEDRVRVHSRIQLRLNSRDDLPGRVKQAVARRRLAELLGEVEWCMMCLAPHELLEVSGPVRIPDDPGRATVNRWEYVDPKDRAAIIALREFAKRHGAWQIFVEQEEHDRDGRYVHLEKVDKLGRDHLKRELDRVQDEDDVRSQRPLRPEQSREIDQWLEQRGAGHGDIAFIRGETDDAGRKRRERDAQRRAETPEQRKERRAREAEQKRRQRERTREQGRSKERRAREAEQKRRQRERTREQGRSNPDPAHPPDGDLDASCSIPLVPK